MNWIKAQSQDDFPRKGAFFLCIQWGLKRWPAKTIRTYHIAFYNKDNIRHYIFNEDSIIKLKKHFRLIHEYFVPIIPPEETIYELDKRQR